LTNRGSQRRESISLGRARHWPGVAALIVELTRQRFTETSRVPNAFTALASLSENRFAERLQALFLLS
jgi:hypothetical protein